MSVAEQEKLLIWKKDVKHAKVKKLFEIKKHLQLKLIKVLQIKNNTLSLAKETVSQT